MESPRMYMLNLCANIVFYYLFQEDSEVGRDTEIHLINIKNNSSVCYNVFEETLSYTFNLLSML